MSFKPVRSFFQDRLLEVDSSFTPHDDAFDTNNVGANNFDRRFHVFYGDVTTSVSNQNTTTDTVNATVTLFMSGERNATEALDESMDIANKFRLQCLKIDKLRNQTFIKRVVCNSIRAEALNTDDNSMKIILNFSVNVIFGLGLDLNC